MNHGLEIIPIAPYRRASAAGVRRYAPVVEERKAGFWQLALIAAGMLVIVARLALPQIQAMRSIQEMGPTERTAIFARAVDDTQVACTLPAASAGALHEHCLHQAEFLALFSECDGACQKLVKSILPHARR
jgi:hypothetical protein